MPTIERATFGNKDGSHQLLETSLVGKDTVLEKLRFIVDRPAGHIDPSVDWSPYWGCHRVDEFWTIWRGEEDSAAPRKNMVKVEVAILPIKQCAFLNDINELLVMIGHTGDICRQDDALKLAGLIVQKLSTNEKTVAIPEISLFPCLVRALWPRLWPNARANLSLRTIFAAEALENEASFKIAVFPAELTPRWRGHLSLTDLEHATGSISKWFAGAASPELERILMANSKQLPGDFLILGRIERIVERLELLNEGQGNVSDALVVIRTQEAFPEGIILPAEDTLTIKKALLGLNDATPEDIRTASLTKLDLLKDKIEVEAALAMWIQKRLPEAPDSDALWIIQHKSSREHSIWWRRGVESGIAIAIEKQSQFWAKAMWRWWRLEPDSIDWFTSHLGSSPSVEIWLANETPKEIDGGFLKKLFGLCRRIQLGDLIGSSTGK